MRLIIKIKNTEVIEHIEREYIRNSIYQCLESSIWSFYHDKPKYKHFCYSNLFPFDSKTGLINSDFSLIISSPYGQLIETIQKKLGNEMMLKLGDKNFEILKMRSIKLPQNIDKIISATPIIVRLPQNLFDKYNVHSQNNYEFWKETEVLNAFLDLVMKNLLLRYKNFVMESEVLGFKTKYKSFADDLRLFSTLKFKKVVYAWDKHFTGTMWEFGIAEDLKDSDIVKYLYEAGLGERNASSGSGFLNLINVDI